MAYPIAPSGFQGDLVDPLTGERLLRQKSWWEDIVANITGGMTTLPMPIEPGGPPPPEVAPAVPSSPQPRRAWGPNGYW